MVGSIFPAELFMFQMTLKIEKILYIYEYFIYGQ